MAKLDLDEIKSYILERGKEYRKNILLYLKWVLEDFENRKSSSNKIVREAFNCDPFYVEGIKTRNEWDRINKRGKHNYLIEHKTLGKNEWLIVSRLNYDELSNFINKFEPKDIPEKVITWEYKMPTKENFLQATKEYKESEWVKSKIKIKIIVEENEYPLKALSIIAIGIANGLDGPANFYMFTTDQLKRYIKDNLEDFQVIETPKQTDDEEEDEDEYYGEEVMSNYAKQPLNQILYGPPGTGKTYNTINKALKIILEAQPDDEIQQILEKDIHTIEERKILKDKFDEYKQSGQIEFVTFHQSYGYEEFVEGINAEVENGNLIYKVTEGIFKKLSNNAKPIESQSTTLNFDWDKGNIFKMSLGGKNEPEILDWCLDNDYISMGWGNDIDFTPISAKDWESFRDAVKSLFKDKEIDRFTIQAIYAFKEWMKKEDLVFVSFGNSKIVAIGQVIGEYEYKDSIDEIRYSQFRKVRWLFKDKAGGIPAEKILNKKISQQTIYKLDKSYIKKDFLDSLFSVEKRPNDKNYILIIDEINRGNISKIFGELITLIEPSKRIGAEEALQVRLPYSNELFGIPQNLYIIGTMNTADRSIALMDTALRRRFHFEEMRPRPDLLEDVSIEGVNVKSLLETMNKRIEYLYDRDHTIGHAYFMSLIDKSGDEAKAELDNIFRNKIIPLLQEYFYDDWEKIQIVLGDHPEQFKKKNIKEDFQKYQFIQSQEVKESDILGFDHPDIENEAVEYKVNSHFSLEMYQKIYGDYSLINMSEE